MTYASAGMAVGALLMIIVLQEIHAQVVQVPLPGSVFDLQVSGPNCSATVGDWYSTTENGLGGGNNYLGVLVPCDWDGRPITIQLQDAALYSGIILLSFFLIFNF
jgi:hypothetical protein